MPKLHGVFLSDVHMPDNICLDGVFKYLKDLRPDIVILGGDIIDAKGMHGVEQMQASQIKLSWYERDKKLLYDFLTSIKKACSPKDLIFMSGNHSSRYDRVMEKYPDAWGGRFDFEGDVVSRVFPNATCIPYGTYHSYFKLGDCVFKHGTLYPENHAKKYALVGLPNKTIYGHLHHFQAYTYHSDTPTLPPRYAVTAGCLCHTSPEWKRGAPHMWANGFISFVCEDGVTTPTIHLIEKGKFYVGRKEYK